MWNLEIILNRVWLVTELKLLRWMLCLDFQIHIFIVHYILCVCYHADATVGAGVPQVVVQQFGGPVLEGFGQSTEQHGKLRRVQLKQGN